MAESPIIQTMDSFLGKLGEAIIARTEAERQISEYTNAIKALAKVIENKELGDSYLASLDELSGKPGFKDAIRKILRQHREGLTPGMIRAGIQTLKLMDLSTHSNPLASIHTTLRRMRESSEPEVEEFENSTGEKVYRLIKQGGITPPPDPPTAQSAFKRRFNRL